MERDQALADISDAAGPGETLFPGVVGVRRKEGRGA